jgi:hypothetical protein
MVLAEVTAENSRSYGYLYEDAQDAFSCRLRCLGPPPRLGNCAELLGTRLDGQYAVGMSEATPPPSAEQLAEWRALVDRIGQGDRSQVVAWDEVAAAGPVATYQVLVPSKSASGSAAPHPCWSARSLASSRSFEWIRPRPA